MRRIALGTILATIAMVGPAAAEDGLYKAKLQAGLGEVLSGNCSTSVLSTTAAYACKNAPAQFVDRLKNLGKIEDVAFKGIERAPAGPQEVYIVKYSGGAQLLWLIGVAPDGKIYAIYTPG